MAGPGSATAMATVTVIAQHGAMDRHGAAQWISVVRFGTMDGALDMVRLSGAITIHATT